MEFCIPFAAFAIPPDSKLIEFPIATNRFVYRTLDDFIEWNGQPANWVDARWTGVLEKREDRLVFVQMLLPASNKR